ncbi:MAG: glucose-1-phosphate thymidylyltransferase RfbA [Candidatus Brocadiae bacterium]|nr:glucose-1-phosphate thymidylyltransferase RfbA [Candidatus Brocadiia bacterium]
MKGIVLSGGAGTRLYPATKAMSKQLLPIYDKPMIYYPISVLMMAGIRDMLIISSPESIDDFKQLLGSGEQWGVQFSYLVQNKPEGIAHAVLISKEYIGQDSFTLILGDNIFWGHGFSDILRVAVQQKQGSSIFLYWVSKPERYGVACIGEGNKVLDIEEKPKQPKSHWAVTGLYCYDHHAPEYAAQLKPSSRGELEITDLSRCYLQKGQLNARFMEEGIAWLDTGTHESMLQASMFVQAIQERQGLLIASPEEIAYRLGYISAQQLLKQAEIMKSTNYGKILLRLVNES